MTERYYLYAVTWPDCSAESFGLGVDPRFPVELVGHGRIAALSSRVGLDQFDVAKLQQGTADLRWLSKVAVRHHEITGALARQWPALPARLGTLFVSRDSLVDKLARCEAHAAGLLQRLGDRQEWATKIYVVEDSHAAGEAARPSDAARAGAGAQYLAAKGKRLEHRRRVEATIRETVAAVEARLQSIADAWHRLRPLPATLTNRPEKMVWNAAFLVSRDALAAFQSDCTQLGDELSGNGLLLETTGPWPVYHFCPTLEPEGQSCAPASVVH